jgi:hypothetical protein
MSENTRWVLTVMAMPLILFLFGGLVTMQGYTDTRQDSAIVGNSNVMSKLHREQQLLLEKLSDNNMKTAEALSQVATTLKELDDRGSHALRSHEKVRGEGAH